MKHHVEEVIDHTKGEVLYDRIQHIRGLRCVGTEIEGSDLKLSFTDPFGTRVVVMKVSHEKMKVEVKEWIKKKVS